VDLFPAQGLGEERVIGAHGERLSPADPLSEDEGRIFFRVHKFALQKRTDPCALKEYLLEGKGLLRATERIRSLSPNLTTAHGQAEKRFRAPRSESQVAENKPPGFREKKCEGL
jgi:hypothetical protein